MWYDGYLQIYTGGGGSGKATRERLAQYKNAIAFQNAFSRFIQDALMRYQIDGVPETCSERVILQSLLWYGCVIIYEKNGGLFSLPGAPTGDGFNMYGDPGKAWVWARNGQMNEEVTLYIPGADENATLKIMTGSRQAGKPWGVMVWENAIRFPFIQQVIFYASAVADCYRMLDTMRNNLKNPFVFLGGESVFASIQKYLRQRDENVDAIGAIDTGVFDVDKVKMLPFDTNSQSLRDATEIIEWYENKFRELCGFNSNSQIDKKGENLITAELSINDEFEAIQADKCIEYINKGLDLCNKFFGTDMECKRKEVIDNVVDADDNNNDIQRADGDGQPISG